MRMWLCLLVGVVPLSVGALASDPNAPVREALQGELETFDQTTDFGAPDPAGALFQPTAGPSLGRYRDRLVEVAGWTGPPVTHRAGFLAGGLGVNVFVPPGPIRGTLLFVHGYLSHSANFAYTFRWYTARGWRVVTLDLPGHGLSRGDRGSVGEFTEYGDAVVRWLTWVKGRGWAGPTVLLAHSLGTAACFEALRRPSTPRPDRVVFCAPLLRTNSFAFLDLAQGLVTPFVKELPSSFGWDGYLDGYRMPTAWFAALSRWLHRLEDQRPVALPLTILTGDHDSVVDSSWNAAEYRRLVPGARVEVLRGRDHLFLASKEDREATHRLLDGVIDPKADFAWDEVRSSYGVRRPVGPAQGTVFFVHGFHSSKDEFGPLLEDWHRRGWLVTGLDLPGEVDDFAVYGAAVRAWWEARDWPGPRVVLAHSMGAAAVTEALRQTAWRPDRVVFLAPLVKTAGHDALRWFSWWPSADARWFGALDRWVGGLGSTIQSPPALTVYQGTDDGVVDARANRPVLTRLYGTLNWIELPGADHWFSQEPWWREELSGRLGAD